MEAFRLAREVGEWDVDGMVDTMPTPLFAEWCEFLKREPLPKAFFYGFAGLARSVARMLGIKHTKIEEFLVEFEGTKVKKTGKQMFAIFSAFAHAHNESLKRG